MQLKSLLLGSVTLAGLASGPGYAADLGILTSLDTCDQLGISGLAIASDSNCLRIWGEVSSSFSYGIWDVRAADGDLSDDMGYVASITVPGGYIDWGYNDQGLSEPSILSADVKAKLNFEATAASGFGPAKAVLKLVAEAIDGDTDPVTVDEAYVSIGEGTVLMAGHKGTVFNAGDDEPLNWLGLFNSQAVNTGVQVHELSRGNYSTYSSTGTSNAIQLTHDLGNGFALAAGLENLDGSVADGNDVAVGVISYKGEALSAHVSLAAENALSGTERYWQAHTGIAATLDAVQLVAAAAFDSDSHWNVLGSASVRLDMFTLAGSVEAADEDYRGAGASLSADLSEGVRLNVGGRWTELAGYASYEVAAGAEAALAEGLTLSGAIGYVYDNDGNSYWGGWSYGWAKLAWAPGGGFTASVKASVDLVGELDGGTEKPGYKIETELKKTFE